MKWLAALIRGLPAMQGGHPFALAQQRAITLVYAHLAAKAALDSAALCMLCIRRTRPCGCGIVDAARDSKCMQRRRGGSRRRLQSVKL